MAIVAVFTAVGTALTGSTGEQGAVFRPGDQAAMVGLGICGALVALAFTRPRVRADSDGIAVRNVFGDTVLPWSVVREIRFERGHPWASLELENDDTVSVLAVQAADKQRELSPLSTPCVPSTRPPAPRLPPLRDLRVGTPAQAWSSCGESCAGVPSGRPIRGGRADLVK